MSNLPQGWAEATVAEVTAPCVSLDPTREPRTEFRYIDIGSIDNSNQTLGEPKTFLGSAAPSRARRLVRHGDVLFSTVRTYLKNIGLVPKELDGSLTSTGIAVLRSNGAVSPEYLFRAVLFDDFVSELSGSQDGTMYPAVSDADVLGMRLALPPLAEQRRIVAKIAALTARSKRARAELQRVRELANVFRRATLIEKFDLKELPHRPLRECAIVSGGLTKNAGRRSATIQRPYLRVANVYENELRLQEISLIGCTEDEADRFSLAPDDVLVVEGNGSLDQLGRAAIWSGEIAGCLHQNHLIKVRPGSQIEPRFLLHWLGSPVGRRSIEEVGATTSGLHTLSISKVARLRLPVPPVREQRAIVARIEAAFARIDAVVREAERAAALLDRLDQATLAKAFRGELLPQDPADEPAATLLARLATARTTAPKLKRGRTSRR